MLIMSLPVKIPIQQLMNTLEAMSVGFRICSRNERSRSTRNCTCQLHTRRAHSHPLCLASELETLTLHSLLPPTHFLSTDCHFRSRQVGTLQPNEVPYSPTSPDTWGSPRNEALVTAPTEMAALIFPGLPLLDAGLIHTAGSAGLGSGEVCLC